LPWADHSTVGGAITEKALSPYPPHGRSLEIPRGWGVSTTKLFKGKYGA